MTASSWVWLLYIALLTLSCAEGHSSRWQVSRRLTRRTLRRGDGAIRLVNLHGGYSGDFGGSAIHSDGDEEDEEDGESEEEEVEVVKPPTAIIISTTSIGSSYLDKKRRISIPVNSTIADLKQQLSTRFPGSPPVPLQRLFFGTRLLKDEEEISNVTALSPMPLTLDMITGTSVYDRTMTVSQALEAYVSLLVQQAYTGQSMNKIFDQSNGVEGGSSDDNELETARYRELFHSLNASLYENFAEEIEQALLEEREPEAFAADTAAWRGDKANTSPVAVVLAKEFDLNWSSLKNFVYFSVLLMVFARFGTNTATSSKFLIAMIPFLWFSKLRQFRVAFKLATYFLLPFAALTNFLMPLLPAPYQAIAVAAKDSVLAHEGPILPRAKASYALAEDEDDEEDSEEDNYQGEDEEEDEEEEEDDGDYEEVSEEGSSEPGDEDDYGDDEDEYSDK